MATSSRDVKLRMLVEVVDKASSQLATVKSQLDSIQKSARSFGGGISMATSGMAQFMGVAAGTLKELTPLEKTIPKLSGLARDMSVMWATSFKSMGQISKIQDPLEKANTVFGKLKGATSSLNGALAFMKSHWMAVAAATYAAKIGFEAFLTRASEGAQAMSVAESFRLMTESMNINGEKMIERLREVSYVFEETTGLMIKSQRMLNEGLSESDVVATMEASRTAARLLGTSVEEAFNRVSEALITLRTRGLKQAFPMDQEKVIKDYAKSIGVTAEYLTDFGKRMAILTEITRQNKDRIRMLGGELHPTLSEKIEKARSKIAEWIEQFSIMAGKTTVGPALTLWQEWDKLTAGMGKRLDELILKSKEWWVAQAQGLMAGVMGMEKAKAFVEWMQKQQQKWTGTAPTATPEEAAIRDVQKGEEAYLQSRKRAQAGYGKDQVEWEKFNKEMVKVGRETDLKLTELTVNGAEVRGNKIRALEIQKQIEIDEMKEKYGAAGAEKVFAREAYWDQKIREAKILQAKEIEKDKIEQRGKAIDLGGQMELSAMEKRQAEETAALQEDNRDLTLFQAEQQEERLRLEADREKKQLVIRRELEVADAIARGKDANAVRALFALEEAKIEQTLADNVSKLWTETNAKRKADLTDLLKTEEGAATYEAPPVMTEWEIEAKKIVNARAKSEAEHLQYLGEAEGDYNKVTEAQVRLLEVEAAEHRLLKEYWNAALEDQKAYDDLMKKRIEKLRVQRALEYEGTKIDYAKNVAELAGTWTAVYEAEKKALANQREIALAKYGGDPEMKAAILRQSALKEEELTNKYVAERDKLTQKQLATLGEVLNDYDKITDAQALALENERKEYRLGIEYRSMKAEEKAQYEDMMARRIAKLKEVRALEAETMKIDYVSKIAQMKGSWDDVYNAQLASLRIQKEMALAQTAMQPGTQELVKRYYDLQMQEAEAYKTLDALKLAQMGLSDATKETTKNLAESYRTLIPEMIKAPGTALQGLFDSLMSGTRKSARDYGKMVAEAFVMPWTKMVNSMYETIMTNLFKKVAGENFFGLIPTIKPQVQAPVGGAAAAAAAPTGWIPPMPDEYLGGVTGAMQGLDTELKKKPGDIGNLVGSLGQMDTSLLGTGSNLQLVSTDMTALEQQTYGLSASMMEGVNSISQASINWSSFTMDIANSVGDLASGAVDMLGSAFSGAGGGAGMLAGLFNFQHGGKVKKGHPNKQDDVIARVSHGEFIHPRRTVNYYGDDVMELMRRRLVPREIFDEFRQSLTVYRPRKMRFQEGGQVGGGAEQGGVTVTPGKMQLAVEIAMEPGLVARMKPPSADDIDLITALKYKAGGHLHKALKER